MHLNFGNIFSQQNVQTILYLTPCVFQHLEWHKSNFFMISMNTWSYT
jgi:hypothetical protein